MNTHTALHRQLETKTTINKLNTFKDTVNSHTHTHNTITKLNEVVREERKNMSVLQNNFAHLAHLSSHHSVGIPTQKSRDDRIRKVDTTNLQLYITADKKRERTDRKALGDTFHEIVVKNIQLEDMTGSLENIIIGEFYKKDKTKTLLCNLIIQYVMRKVGSSSAEIEFYNFGMN